VHITWQQLLPLLTEKSSRHWILEEEENIRLFSLKSPASSSSSLIKSKPKDACIFDQGAGNKSYAFAADA